MKFLIEKLSTLPNKFNLFTCEKNDSSFHRAFIAVVFRSWSAQSGCALQSSGGVSVHLNIVISKDLA